MFFLLDLVAGKAASGSNYLSIYESAYNKIVAFFWLL